MQQRDKLVNPATGETYTVEYFEVLQTGEYPDEFGSMVKTYSKDTYRVLLKVVKTETK